MKKIVLLVILFFCTHLKVDAQFLSDDKFYVQPNEVFNPSLVGDMCTTLLGSKSDVYRASANYYTETNGYNQGGVSLDVPVYLKKGSSSYLGIEGFFYTDYAKMIYTSYWYNFTNLTNSYMGLSLAYHQKLDKQGKVKLNGGLGFVNINGNNNEKDYNPSGAGFFTVKKSFGCYMVDAGITLSVDVKKAIIYVGAYDNISSENFYGDPAVYYNNPSPTFYIMSNCPISKRVSILPKASLLVRNDLLSPDYYGNALALGTDVAYNVTREPNKKVYIYAGYNYFKDKNDYLKKYQNKLSAGIILPVGLKIGLSAGHISTQQGAGNIELGQSWVNNAYSINVSYTPQERVKLITSKF